MAKFFEEDKKEEEENGSQEESEKITIGEAEFTQEELEELVGKAKKISEFEEKQGQTWDEVAKSWGQRGERIGEYKKKLEEYEKLIENQSKPQEVVDEEKVKAQVIAEAQKFGLVTREELDKQLSESYQRLRSGEKTLAKVKRVIKTAKRSGYPAISEEDLLEYMRDPNNPADPENAYKLKFMKEIREVDEGKLNSIKKRGIMTESKSTAGSKEFTPPKITKENLNQLIRDKLAEG